MPISDRQFHLLRRLQILTGVVPVGLFLLSHFAINGRAIAGRDAYRAGVEWIAGLPGLVWIEVALIGLPIVAHLALGAWLGLSRQGAFQRPWPSPRLRWIQRASGFYLAMYVVIHVWALRLDPARLAGERDLFDLVASQLRHPALFALQALAVLSAAAHFGLGMLALFGPDGLTLPAGARAARAIGLAGFVLLSVLGLNAMLAFVWPAAQWMAR